MYCTHCGTENSNLAKFCKACGSNLSGAPSPAGTPPMPLQPRTAQYAGFWMRFLAVTIDGLVLVVPFFIISLIGLLLDFSTSGGYRDPNLGGGRVIAYLLNLVAGWLYFALMESSSKQATVGKLALGLKVTDLDGNRLTFGRATGRYFAKMINGFTFSIGYIIAGFTKHKQALHDLIASTLVVKKG